MRNTQVDRSNENEKILLDTEGLRTLLSCGLVTAKEIGTKADARVQIGRRVFWNRKKVEAYIERISGIWKYETN